MQFNFNGASAEESKEGIRVDMSASAFGESNKQNVHNLRARVLGSGPNECQNDSNEYFFFSMNIKIKEDFSDVHGLCEKFNKTFKEEGGFSGLKGSLHFKFADNRIYVRGYADAHK